MLVACVRASGSGFRGSGRHGADKGQRNREEFIRAQHGGPKAHRLKALTDTLELRHAQVQLLLNLALLYLQLLDNFRHWGGRQYS